MNKTMHIKRPWLLVLGILLCLAAGAAGSFFTTPAIPTWYAALHKPAFNPPSWLFGPVWTILYIMMGIALYLVQTKNLQARGHKVNDGNRARGAVAFFGVQLVLNVLWSALFFGLRSPLLALVNILFLWMTIAVCILLFSRISKPAAWLLVPYLLWVSFATVLNYAIVLLN